MLWDHGGREQTLWDRDTMALRMQEACGCHGTGSAMGRGCRMLWVGTAVGYIPACLG